VVARVDAGAEAEAHVVLAIELARRRPSSIAGITPR
jgi:hypothetical protein